MLRFHQVSKYFGAQLLLDGVNWSVHRGQRIGLVGANGAGKSTLLQLCIGEIEPDEGYVKRNNNVRVLSLPQAPPADGGASGGERQLAALSTLLDQNADLLLLDEPTTNLDEKRIRWLEEQLISQPGALIIVSHDRDFLDSTVDHIVELDALTHKLVEYSGNYSFYKERKARENERIRRTFVEQQRRVKKLEAAASDLKRKAQSIEYQSENDYYRGVSRRIAQAAKAREKRMHRMLSDEQRIDLPREQQAIRLDLPAMPIHDRLLLECRDLTLGYEQPLLVDVNLNVRSGQRIVILGDNGAGKSLLVKTLIAELPPISGDLFRRSNLEIGYLAQNVCIDGQVSVLDWFTNQIASRTSKTFPNDSAVRTFLHRFLFSSDAVFKLVSQLSGGEKMRLQLAVFNACETELIILDEPTSHLDVLSIQSLEDALAEFPGALLVVSHDRTFRDALGAHESWLVEAGRVHVL